MHTLERKSVWEFSLLLYDMDNKDEYSLTLRFRDEVLKLLIQLLLLLLFLLMILAKPDELLLLLLLLSESELVDMVLLASFMLVDGAESSLLAKSRML